MNEPTPLSAEEEQAIREEDECPACREYAIPDVIPRLLATLDAARATVPAAEPHKATWYPEAGEWCCPLHARPVPAADDRERLRRVVESWALDDTCLRGEVERFLDDILRAGVSPSTGDAE